MEKQYLVKLNSHVLYTGPAIKESELDDFLEQRTWKKESVDIAELNPYFLGLYKKMKW